MMKVVNCIHHVAVLAAKKGFSHVMETTDMERKSKGMVTKGTNNDFYLLYNSNTTNITSKG
jgi:hypothetical protein